MDTATCEQHQHNSHTSPVMLPEIVIKFYHCSRRHSLCWVRNPPHCRMWRWSCLRSPHSLLLPLLSLPMLPYRISKAGKDLHDYQVQCSDEGCPTENMGLCMQKGRNPRYFIVTGCYIKSQNTNQYEKSFLTLKEHGNIFPKVLLTEFKPQLILINKRYVCLWVQDWQG